MLCFDFSEQEMTKSTNLQSHTKHKVYVGWPDCPSIGGKHRGNFNNEKSAYYNLQQRSHSHKSTSLKPWPTRVNCFLSARISFQNEISTFAFLTSIFLT